MPGYFFVHFLVNHHHHIYSFFGQRNNNRQVDFSMASFATELQPVPGSNASFGVNPSIDLEHNDSIPAFAQGAVTGQTAAPWQAGSSNTTNQTILKALITRPKSKEKLVVDNDRPNNSHDPDNDNNEDAAIDAVTTTTSSWPKKRPRSTKDYLVTIPRTDIRRLYPLMMMNIFNGHDPLRVHSFFMTYSVPSMAATYESFGTIDLNPAPTRSYVSATPTYLHGPHRMALFYATMLQLNPDQILRVHGAKARVDTERRVTEISCIMVHEFTQLYAVNPMQITDEIVNFIVAEEATKQQQQQVAASDHLSDASTASLTSDHDDEEDEDGEDEGDDEEVAEETSTSAASASASASPSVALSVAVGSPSLTTASSSSSLSSTAKPEAPAPQAHRPEERRRSRKKMSRRTAVHDDRDVVFPDTFDLYRRIYHTEVPRMEKPPSIRIQYDYVIVVDALRRLLLVDFHNPQVTVVV